MEFAFSFERFVREREREKSKEKEFD